MPYRREVRAAQQYFLTRIFDFATFPQVWQNIKPQLEETIRLRRIHAVPKFQALRRQDRLDEFKKRFIEYRPQLNTISKEKLFVNADISELPVVKELAEEDKCRVPLTEERWQLVVNVLPDAVLAHAKMIERDCGEKIAAARVEAFGANGDIVQAQSRKRF